MMTSLFAPLLSQSMTSTCYFSPCGTPEVPDWVLTDDRYEEDAEDYLQEHNILHWSRFRFNTNSRPGYRQRYLSILYCKAWENGWRPVPRWAIKRGP